MPSAISDALWADLAPRVERAKRSRAGAPPGIPDRTFLEALVYLADSGCKWRQLPDRYGAWDAVYNRFRRWLAAGVLGRLFADLPPRAAALDGVRRVFVDSTTARAHPHAAGAPAAGGGQAGQCLGRSRGGFSTKVHLACTDERTAAAVELTPGQAGDAPVFDRLWDQARPRLGVVDEVVADRAYDSDAIRLRLIAEDVAPPVPNHPRRRDPWPLLAESYRERNRAERLVGRLEQFRRLATRYDKLAETFLGFVHLALTVIRLT